MHRRDFFARFVVGGAAARLAGAGPALSPAVAVEAAVTHPVHVVIDGPLDAAPAILRELERAIVRNHHGLRETLKRTLEVRK